MIDREKVIKGVESCLRMGRLGYENCDELNCPYFEKGVRLTCWLDVLDDAIALLKEQEAVEPVVEQESMVCGVCGYDVIWTREIENNYTTDCYFDFCPHCGRQVKWE